MPDTIRQPAALLALLADNTTKDISPQDQRDVYVSGVRVFRKTFTNAEILAWDDEDTPEVMPAAPAGQYYNIVGSVTCISKIVEPYTNIDEFEELVLGFDDDNEDACMPFWYQQGQGGTWGALSQSKIVRSPALISGAVIAIGEDTGPGYPFGRPIGTGSIIGKNLALYFTNNGNGPFEGGDPGNTITIIIAYTLETA